MAKEIEFSIITCTLNSERFLKDNIASVESQRYDNFEHIFVDGRSTDGTLEIIRRYQKRHPKKKIKIFHSYPRGISSAMNVGIRRSSGKYIIHLHSDDSLYASTTLSQVACFLSRKPHFDWIYGKINVLDSGVSIGQFPRNKVFQRADCNILKYFNFVPHQSVFIKREIFEKFGSFSRKYKCCMDYDYWLRIANKTNWGYFDQNISNYTQRIDSVSCSPENKNRNAKEYLDVQRIHLKKIEFIFAYLFRLFVDIRSRFLRRK